MPRHRLALFVLLVLLTSALPAAAQEPPAIRLEAVPFWGGTFRSGSWLPFHITVANDGRDAQAVVSIQTGGTFATTLDLPQGAQKQVTLYARPTGAFKPKATVRVVVAGTEVAQHEVQLTAVGNGTRAIGMLSTQPLALPLPVKRGQRFQAVPLTVAELPDRSEGWMLFDALVLDGTPLSELQPAQAQAFTDWVLAGGKLVVGGDQLETTLAQLPPALHIVAGTRAAPSQITPALLPTLGTTLPATLLQPGAGARVVDQAGADVLGVQQSIGRGMVTTLGYGLSAPQLAQMPDAGAALWDRVAQFPVVQPNMPQIGPEARTEQLSGALMMLPTLAMPPLGLLVGLFVAYMLIVGPGLYLLLRRWDRQAWAWIALPSATLVFSLLAYGYALQLRGNDVILNQISVVEPLGDRSLVQTLGGVFSPRAANYTINSPHDLLFWSLPNQFGNPQNNPKAAQSQLQQAPAAVRDLPVAQWSMSSFAAQQMIDGTPLQASLSLDGNMLRGEVRNTGTLPVNDLVLVQHSRIARIGALQPGEQRAVELKIGAGGGNQWGEPISWQIIRGDQPPNQDGPWSTPMTPQMSMRASILDSLFMSPMGNSNLPAMPQFIGWIDGAPVPLQLNEGRAQHQQLTLVSLPVTPSYAGQQVTLPRGWLTPSFEASTPNSGQCSNGESMGWYVESGVITTTLQLPSDLQPLQISKATLHSFMDMPNPNTKLSIYDWSTNAWSDIDKPNLSGSKVIDQPSRFVGPTGTIQLRTDLSKPGNMGMGGGCMGLDISLEGTQP